MNSVSDKIKKIGAPSQLNKYLYQKPLNKLASKELKLLREKAWELCKDYQNEGTLSVITNELDRRCNMRNTRVVIAIAFAGVFIGFIGHTKIMSLGEWIKTVVMGWIIK